MLSSSGEHSRVNSITPRLSIPYRSVIRALVTQMRACSLLRVNSASSGCDSFGNPYARAYYHGPRDAIRYFFRANAYSATLHVIKSYLWEDLCREPLIERDIACGSIYLRAKSLIAFALDNRLTEFSAMG